MSNFVRVSFPNSPAEPKRVHRATLTKENYKHEFATFYFRDWGANFNNVKPGTPIKANFGGKEFVGYVHDIRGEIDSNKDFLEVEAIGASFVMRQASQEIYRNITASEVVKKIAQKYNFSYKVEPHPRVYPQISQSGLTDWELMVKLAKQCGYFLRAENTTIYFQPILKEFEEVIPEAPIFTKNDAGFRGISGIYSFKPVIGETLFHQGADKSAVAVAGVDPRSKQTFRVTNQTRARTTRKVSQKEFFDKHATNVVANEYSVAKSEAESADEKSKFPYRAELVVVGTSRVHPGMPVYLDGLGDAYSGYWVALSVEHLVEESRLNFEQFTTTMTVGTDSLGEADSRYPLKPPTKPTRAISPGIRKTLSKPKSEIKTAGLSVKPIIEIGLVKRKNRPGSPSTSLSATTWSSDKGDLKGKKPESRKSPAAQAKVAAANARR